MPDGERGRHEKLMKKKNQSKRKRGAAVGCTDGLDAREQDIVAHCLIILKVHVAFMELAGCTAKDINPDDFTKEATEEIRKSGVKDPNRVRAIMFAIGERI